MPARVYTVGQRITYTFYGGIPGSVLSITLPGAVTVVSPGAHPNVTFRLDNGLTMTTPAADQNLAPA